MDARDPNHPAVDLELAAAGDRQVVLADLVALRKIRIEVVLAVELGVPGHLAVERQGGLYDLFDGPGVDYRKHSGHAKADLADVGVRRRPQVVGGAAAEHL